MEIVAIEQQQFDPNRNVALKRGPMTRVVAAQGLRRGSRIHYSSSIEG
jgi:hypothetical protein